MSCAREQISECMINPFTIVEDMKKPFPLTPFDLVMLSMQYIQAGLLFAKPPNQQNFMDSFLKKLKHSLSIALIDFYPLAARLATTKVEHHPLYNVFVDCSKFDGVKFVYASMDKNISDVTLPTYTPSFVHGLFDLNKMCNHDGHTIPLMSIQVTELVDGIFIGCSMNHTLGDGTTFWNFINKWSDIFEHYHEGIQVSKSHPTILDPCFLDSRDSFVNLPFKIPKNFVQRYNSPQLKEKTFHFSKDSLWELKTKVNLQNNTTMISSFQSLSALIWRSITRTRTQTRDISLNEATTCVMVANNRARLNPPLPQGYFRNCLNTLKTTTIVGELLDHDIGWAAMKLHNMVIDHDDKAIHKWVENWMKSPSTYQIERIIDPLCVLMGNSPRFNMYGNEFGLGKPIAVKIGCANKTDGKVTCNSGCDEGSIDLEICLFSDIMEALECDEELMNFAS